MSFTDFLDKLKRRKISKIMVVDAVDDFLRANDDTLRKSKMTINQHIGALSASDAIVIFVVTREIESISSNPTINNKPISSIIPKQLAMGKARAGHVYYPYI